MRQVQQCSSVETNPAQKDLDSVLYVGNISSGTGTEVKVNHGSSGCARGDLTVKWGSHRVVEVHRLLSTVPQPSKPLLKVGSSFHRQQSRSCDDS